MFFLYQFAIYFGRDGHHQVISEEVHQYIWSTEEVHQYICSTEEVHQYLWSTEEVHHYLWSTYKL
jgi:hypothetical protein